MPFQEYSPEQAAPLPLHVRDVLSEKHLVFLIRAMVEKQDLSEWESAYREEGQRPYHPALLGRAEPDHKAICEFLRRHGRRVKICLRRC